MKEFIIIRGYKAITIAQKTLLLQPTKFHVILTLRLMISTSVFLSCTMISSARESPGKPWQFILHQSPLLEKNSTPSSHYLTHHEDSTCIS